MTYRVSLASSRAKLERAELHRDALDNNIGQVFSDKANQIPLSAEVDRETGYYTLSVQRIPDLTAILTRFGLVFGDAIHNLRGCLDHLFWQLACLHTNGSPPKPRRVQFPMDDNPGSFPKRPVKADVHPDHWDMIETHQPYRGLDGRPDSWSGLYAHPLALLRDFTNDDKHKITTPLLAIPSRFTLASKEGIVWQNFPHLIASEFPDLSTFEVLNVGKPVSVGATVGRAHPTGPGAKPHFDDAAEVIPQIALAEGRPIVPTLDRITKRVALILSEFEVLFPA